VLLIVTICAVGLIIHRADRSAMEATIKAQRNYVFCDLLKPGMTHEEVREVLTQFGTLEEHENRSPGGYLSVRAYYIDSEIDRQFGGYFVLSFVDEHFHSVGIPIGIGEYTNICDSGK
jgi:hypothetical protein